MERIANLSKRGWVLKNLDWFMGEVVFHRENQQFFKAEKIEVWKFDNEEGKAVIR